jgi:hypothetical protein
MVKQQRTRRAAKVGRQIPSLTPEQIQRAIYIDFEGTKKDPPSFLGWSCEGEWAYCVIEEALFPAAAYPHTKGVGSWASPEQCLRMLLNRAMREQRVFLAWSSHELQMIKGLVAWTAEELAYWEQQLINALPIGRRWSRREGIAIPEIEGSYSARPNKWSLSGFRIATGYPPVNALHEPGHTASRLRHVRDQLIKRDGDFARLTRVAKGKWTKVLTHNYHDCVGLAHVMHRINGVERSA